MNFTKTILNGIRFWAEEKFSKINSALEQKQPLGDYVASVNGKTGIVNLNSTDVGALPTTGGTVTYLKTNQNLTIGSSNAYSLVVSSSNTSTDIGAYKTTGGTRVNGITLSPTQTIVEQELFAPNVCIKRANSDYPSLAFIPSSRNKISTVLQAEKSGAIGLYNYGLDQDANSKRYFEAFMLPAPTSGHTANKIYHFLTTKEPVKVQNGGTGSTSPEGARTNLDVYSKAETEALYIKNPNTATVGQVLKVKAVDDNGKPIDWEAVDPWIISSSTEGSTKQFKLTVDDEGVMTATEIV